jgi:KDO2-lipid IV(A) lauroyltransferase
LRAPLQADAAQAAGAINQEMEALIRQCPQQYLWGYARYKQPRQEA